MSGNKGGRKRSSAQRPSSKPWKKQSAPVAVEGKREAPNVGEPVAASYEVVDLSCDDFKITGESYASKAEEIMAQAEKQGFWKLTTTKLRSIYSLIMNIYVRASTESEYVRHKSNLQYLKVRMAYEAGRETSVKEFLNASFLMKLVDAVGNYDQFKLYCRYAEALVAYFKYYGGED